MPETAHTRRRFLLKLGVIGYGHRILGVINGSLREIEPDKKSVYTCLAAKKSAENRSFEKVRVAGE